MINDVTLVAVHTHTHTHTHTRILLQNKIGLNYNIVVVLSESLKINNVNNKDSNIYAQDKCA